MFQKFKIIFLAIFSLFTSWAYGQQLNGTERNFSGNSPYSKVGIGDIAPIGTLRNIGMGGIGVSSAHDEFINNLNPALLPNNRIWRYDSLYTILEGSFAAQFRRISNSNALENSGGINFNSFAYLFPVTKRWTSSVGIRPFSSVNYSFFAKSAVTGSPADTAEYFYNGSGGIYQADFSNGVKITRNINLGFQASYLFGSIRDESFTRLIYLPDSVYAGSNMRSTYSGFMFRPGLSFRKQLNSYQNRDSVVFFNFGFTYEFFANITADQSLFIERKNQSNALLSRSTVESTSNNISFPRTYRFGISFDKYQAWNIGADFSYTNWENYKGGSAFDTLKNSYSISLGSEFALNPGKDFLSDEEKKLKRKYLRAGFTYTMTPLYFSGNQLNDISFSFGYTFPVGKQNFYKDPLPKLNLALVVGQRGTHKDNLVRDQYFKIYAGLTINDKWFRRRRID
jgi:hypothetical protein